MRVDTHFPGNDPATLGGIVYAAAAVRAIPTLVTESFIGAAALLIIIVSTNRRYGGFAKAVGLRVMSTAHGLGYAKLVIVVDEDV